MWWLIGGFGALGIVVIVFALAKAMKNREEAYHAILDKKARPDHPEANS